MVKMITEIRKDNFISWSCGWLVELMFTSGCNLGRLSTEPPPPSRQPDCDVMKCLYHKVYAHDPHKTWWIRWNALVI